MKITAVRLRRVRGTMPTEGNFWEERLVRPIDIYPEYRARSDHEGGVQVDSGRFRLETVFVQVETDEGVTGIAGPVPDGVASIVAARLRPIIMGQDPIATELLWDQMHRIMVHGRQGDAMLAISAVDCALWDLKGRWLNQPVYRLHRRPDASRHPGLCEHARLRRARHGRGAGARAGIQGARLYRAEMVLPPRADERP